MLNIKEDNNISFIDFQNSRYYDLLNNDLGPNTLCLYDQSNKIDIIDYIPKNFTISTNNGSSKFNIDMLYNTSLTVNNLFEDEVNLDIPLHIPIDDKKNVLSKFEQLYQGKLVFFTKDELPSARTITEILYIANVPNYLKPKHLRTLPNPIFGFNSMKEDDLETGVIINKRSLYNFLENEVPICFTIKTKKDKYVCNVIGVYSSNVIRQFLENNNDQEKYTFNYEDEFGEFQLICDFFNFQKVTINASNLDSLKRMATELQIDIILDKIENYLKSYEKVSQNIDDQQNIISSIENLVDLLYKIKDHSVEFVKNSIVDSFWSETEENVQELAAFILQVVENDSSIHSYLADLLYQLNEEANEENKLNILLPFIVRKSVNSLGFDSANCSFVYNLHKKGLIPKDELIEKIKYFFERMKKMLSNSYYLNYEFRSYFNEENTISNIFYWFLPELIEADLFHKYSEQLTSKCKNFIQRYLQDKIDQFKKMRDSNEPDDLITQAIRIDDIDSLQTIISRNQIDILKGLIPFNIFEKETKYDLNFLDYAANCGSIKCFKYLLLNHSKITENTFLNALKGGNSEIIRIVDQNFKFDDENYIDMIDNGYLRKSQSNKTIKIEDIIEPLVKKHMNDIFDWVFEHKLMNKQILDQSLQNIVTCCVNSGNAHALIEIIDKGFTFDFTNIIKAAWQNGFYRLSILILNVMNQKTEVKNIDFRFAVYFGNISILKLCCEIAKNKFNIEKALVLACDEDQISIVRYYFENIINDDFPLSDTILYILFENLITNGCNDIFYYLLDQYKQSKISFLNKFNWSSLMLSSDVFKFGDDKVIKKVIDLVIEKPNEDSFEKHSLDFTQPFIASTQENKKEIYQYIIDKNLYINFEKVVSSCKVSSMNIETFSILFKCSPPEIKEIFLNISIYDAIDCNKKDIVEFCLIEKATHEFALLKAVQKKYIKIVELVLKYDNSPSFINKNTRNGTALSIAVSNNNLQIVNLLLSIKGIDPSLYDSNKMTPLLIAVNNYNVEIVNSILDFYGEDFIIMQKSQFRNMMIRICNLLTSKNTDPKMFPLLTRIRKIKGLDFNYYCEEFELLPNACRNSNNSLFEYMLTIENINVNFCDSKTGRSPLMISIECGNNKITETLLNHPQTNINIRSYNDETALTIACGGNKLSIIDLLINHERFDPEESRVNYCFFISNDKTLQNLSACKHIDVNYKIFNNHTSLDINGFSNYSGIDNLYETALTYAVRFKRIEKVDLIIKHPSFDKYKSCLQKSIFLSIEKDCFEIFKMLFNLIDNNADNYKFNGQSLFSTALQFYNADVIKAILDNENFDYKKYNLLAAFTQVSTINENSFKIMSFLYEFDQKHDRLIDFSKLLPNGKSFYTALNLNADGNSYIYINKIGDIKSPNIEKIVDLLLKNGADPNMIDKFDVYPLEHAIMSRNYEFAFELISSDKVDLSPIIHSKMPMNETEPYETYLHLAAKFSENIFKLIFEENVIDINATDSNGNTPLIVAVSNQKFKIIQLLFTRKDLDYLHCNNEGKNALEIWLGSSAKLIKDRDEFQRQLMAFSKKYNNKY